MVSDEPELIFQELAIPILELEDVQLVAGHVPG